jgi:hypothetical protein
MPYICLARTDIPDGVLQVLDLVPNTSLRSDLDPPGQTRYLNRAQIDALSFDAATGQVTRTDEPASAARGLAAYLADRVEAGGLTAESQTIQILAGLAAGTIITIDGPSGIQVDFTAVAGGAVAANQEFNDVANSGSAINTATSLVGAINDAASQALLETSIGGVASGETISADNTAGTVDTVTIVADVRPGTNYLQTTVAEDSGAVEITLGGATMTRAVQSWTAATVAAAAAALLARVDAGQVLALGNINTVLAAAAAGTELTSAGGSASTGVALDILELMAGRGYQLPSGSVKLVAAALPLTVWDSTQLGSFTRANTVFDTQMVGGVIGPVNPWIRHKGLAVTNGGDIEQTEHKGIRDTVDDGSFQQSLLGGYLSKMQDGSVTLFPDSDLVPFQATHYQPGPNNAAVTPARIVTVYNDDGTLA